MRRAMPTRPLWPLNNSQSLKPAALAIAFTRRAIWDSDSLNKFSSLLPSGGQSKAVLPGVVPYGLDLLWSGAPALMTVRRWHGGDTLPAAPERVACAVHFQDAHMVGEAIQQRASESFWPKDLSPLVEGQVGGHQDDAPLIG